MSAAPFDPLRILKTLHRHGVRFVIIGGIAGRLWGSPTVTNDLDICYGRDGANLAALAGALRDLKVKLRGAERDLKFVADPRTLENGDHFTFTTVAGNLGCIGTPKGSGGYETLARNAESMDVGGVDVLVAALPELVAMKRAAGRPKDLIEVAILTAMRDEIERG